MKRTMWEILIILVLAGAGFGLWQWSEINAQRAVGEQVERQQKEVGRLEQDYDAWIESLARDQAEAVFQAFAAGIRAAVVAGRDDALRDAKLQILHLPEVLSVHLFAPDGTVIFSSDDKLTTTGRVDERARWALEAKGLTSREGDRPGTLEVAAPIAGDAGPEAILWIVYRTEGLRDKTRPPGLAPP